MVMYDDPAKARVAAGAEELDKLEIPEWWERIDYDVLDLEEGETCVLGQVLAADAHMAGVISGFLYAVNFPLNHLAAHTSAFGFCDNGQNGDADNLREAWIDFIEGRKAELS